MITNKSTKKRKSFRKGASQKNRLKISEGNKIYTSSIDQTTPCNTWPLSGKIDNGPSNQEEINWKKLEKKHSDQNCWNFCKTRTEKSSTNMFNFHVVLTGHDKLADNGRANKCRGNSKPHQYQQKVQKKKFLQKTWVLTVKQFEDFSRKEFKTSFSTFRKTRWNTKTLRPSTGYGPC